MINFENVSFKYPKFELKNLNFQIESGEIVALTGNNACGKTTLLNLMAGLIKAKKGKVLVDGKKPVCGKDIGMVFQNPDNQIIFSTVEDDICFTLKTQKVPKSEWSKILSDVLSKVHLEGFEKHETATLSAGQKQRLAIANMLAISPSVLLFDEVSVYLDPTAKKELFKLILELKSQGITIVFATNLLDEIVYADRVMVLKGGQVLAFENRENLIKNLSLFEEAELEVPLKLKLLNVLKTPSLAFDDDVLNEISGRLK